MSLTKTCVNCGMLGAEEHFYGDNRNDDKKKNVCKRCEDITRLKRELREAAGGSPSCRLTNVCKWFEST